jgi:fatty-acyl-CoA synthase
LTEWSPPPCDGLADRLAHLHGDRPALTDATGHATTFTALAELAQSLAARLAAAGVARGSRVAVLSSNRVELVALLLACNRIGGVLVPINWRLSASEVAALVRDCEPSLLLADSVNAALARGGPVPALGFEAFVREAAKAPPTPARCGRRMRP